MRVLIAYDGSVYAMAAIDDLRHAGLPTQTEAIVVSVAHHGWSEEQNEGNGIDGGRGGRTVFKASSRPGPSPMKGYGEIPQEHS